MTAVSEIDVTLRAPRSEDMPAVLSWRNQSRVGLRTPRLQTETEQYRFYDRIVSDTTARYWSAQLSQCLVAFTGLTSIEWENGRAEISLITDRQATNRGIGSSVVDLVLREAFNGMRLLTVYGECYACNPALGFWQKIVREHEGGSAVVLPRTKWWDGKLWDSYYFTLPRP